MFLLSSDEFMEEALLTSSEGRDEAVDAARLSIENTVVLADPEWDILWHSNAPWVGSGYGVQSGLFGSRIAQRLNYRLAYSAFWGLKGAKLKWAAPNGRAYTVYPGASDKHGNEVMNAHFQDWTRGNRKSFFITLTDPWVLNSEIIRQLPTLAWIPIDHDPLIPPTAAWLKKSGAVPVAMSRWGAEIMRNAGHDPLYVPHGFDPQVFYPADDRAALRKVFGIPESAFVVGMVAANLGQPGRKCYPEAIAAFAQFKEKHPDAVLYLHTQLEPGNMGVDLVELCRANGVWPIASDQYRYATHYPAPVVASLMNTFDVLLNATMGEGFGVPMVEANACGVPVITTNFSASPEVAPTKVGNWAVGGQAFWTNFKSYQVRPNISELVDALEQAYSDPEDVRVKRRTTVAKWASTEYEADYVTDTFWKPALQEAAIRINWDRKKSGLVLKP